MDRRNFLKVLGIGAASAPDVLRPKSDTEVLKVPEQKVFNTLETSYDSGLYTRRCIRQRLTGLSRISQADIALFYHGSPVTEWQPMGEAELVDEVFYNAQRIKFKPFHGKVDQACIRANGRIFSMVNIGGVLNIQGGDIIMFDKGNISFPLKSLMEVLRETDWCRGCRNWKPDQCGDERHLTEPPCYAPNPDGEPNW